MESLYFHVVAVVKVVVFWFKIWDKWTPKTCWKETSEHLCINITNVQGKQPTIRYGKTAHTSPPPSRSQSSSPPYSACEPNILTPMIEDDNEYDYNLLQRLSVVP
jgi:hypothetical protein